MNQLLRKTKKIVALTLLIAMVIVQNGALVVALNLFPSGHKIGTVQAIYNSTQISLSNANFENPTSTSYPISASNWTKVNADESVTSGLINISQSVYDEKQEDYKLNFNPGKAEEVATSENKVLMINAGSASTKMGYQSSSFVLAKNGYYTIEVLVYTQNANDIVSSASMYLTGDSVVEKSANSKILGITTNGTWKKYQFFVETSANSDKTLRLELYLGAKESIVSKGAVFFDNVKIQAHSNEVYYTKVNNLNYSETNYSILNLKEQLTLNTPLNGNFEQVLNDPATNNTGWKTLTENGSIPNSEYAVNGIYYIGANFDKTLTKVETNPTNANMYGNQKALLINNINPASIGFESSDIFIPQHKLYRLSVWVKTGTLENGATIKLVQQNPYGENNTTYTPVTQSFDTIKTTSTSNEKYDNWVQYSFLIKGSVFNDSYVNLQLWLGTESKAETGYVFYDNVELYELTSSEYSSFSTGTTAKEVNLSGTTGAPSITNGNFNNINITDLTNTYPYQVKDWAVSSNSTNYSYAQVKNGVINTKASHFNLNSINYGFANPGNLNNQVNDEVSNNVFVMGNLSSTSQIYTSGSKTLSANSYYLLTFYVQTQSLTSNEVSVQLLANTTPIYSFHKLESSLEWTKYSLYLKTGLETVNASIQLMLGSKQVEVTGYAFFDNVSINTVESTEYENAVVSGVTKKVTLASENFNAISSTKNNGLYTPLNFTGNNLSTAVTNEFIQTGVLNTTEFNTDGMNFTNIENPYTADPSSNNVLMIGATDDAHYTYTSNLAYNIAANKYYKFTVYIKTQGLSQLSENLKLDANNNPVPYGASVYLTGFEGKFNGINTQVNQITNEYQAYTFYILAASTKTTNLVLALGDENALTKGYAFFSNITLEEVNKEAYETIMTELKGTNPPKNILNLENATVEEDDEPTQEENKIDFDFLVIPTLITSLALIIALIGYFLRQIKFNRIIRRRIKTEIYDRNRTLSVEHERREVVKERQARLVKLKEQLSQIQLEIEQNEQAYKLSKQDDVELTVEQQESIKDLNEKEVKAFKQKQKQARNKQKQREYLEKRERLEKEFERIEKEIEKLEREERIMFEKYRNYRAQVKAIKSEIKQKTKEARIKRKVKKQKEKAKRKLEKQQAKKQK